MRKKNRWKFTWLCVLVLLSGQLFCQDTFTDTRDGKVYPLIKIGKQTWLAKDLSYKPEGVSEYGAEPDSTTYGYLYDWPMANKVCPLGWHLPSQTEWNELRTIAGGEEKAGKSLKSTKGWLEAYGTDSLGFNAKPGGYWDAFNETLCGQGKYGNWWTSTPAENEGRMAWIYSMEFSNDSLSSADLYTIFKYSVRCIQDSK